MEPCIARDQHTWTKCIFIYKRKGQLHAAYDHPEEVPRLLLLQDSSEADREHIAELTPEDPCCVGVEDLGNRGQQLAGKL